MNIDFKLLKQQKLTLVKMAMCREPKRFTKTEIDALDGIICLLDAIQDEEKLRKKYNALSIKITHKNPQNSP